jgi:hypothetical protein
MIVPGRPGRHIVDRQTYKERRSAAWAEWQSLAAWDRAPSATTAPARDEFALD